MPKLFTPLIKVSALKDVDPFSLPSVDFAQRKQLPTCAGVYFVLADTEVLYIGQAQNIHKRHANHNKAKQFEAEHASRITWFKCNRFALNGVEQRFIKKFRPRLNKEKFNSMTPAKLPTYRDLANVIDDSELVELQETNARLKAALQSTQEENRVLRKGREIGICEAQRYGMFQTPAFYEREAVIKNHLEDLYRKRLNCLIDTAANYITRTHFGLIESGVECRGSTALWLLEHLGNKPSTSRSSFVGVLEKFIKTPLPSLEYEEINTERLRREISDWLNVYERAIGTPFSDDQRMNLITAIMVEILARQAGSQPRDLNDFLTENQVFNLSKLFGKEAYIVPKPLTDALGIAAIKLSSEKYPCVR